VDEIVEKLALQNRPTKIAIVEVPEGTMLRKSIAGEQEWVQGKVLQGGGTQYEIFNRDNDWFQPLGSMNELFK
jgi:hypothetical protein